MHRHVGLIGSVHSHHTHGQGMFAGKCAEAHQSHVDRDLRHLGQFEQFLRGAGEHHAAAHIENRLFGLGNRFSRLLDLPLIALVRWVIPSDRHRTRIAEIRFGH